MSCPHAETTALLAVFGESPVDFEHHLNGCDECLRVVQSHTQTLSIVEPTLQRVQAAVMELNQPKSKWVPGTILVLIAATLLLAVQMTPSSTESNHLDIDSPIHASTIATLQNPFDTNLDLQLDSLEAELVFFTLE